jgi:hypothetical protein
MQHSFSTVAIQCAGGVCMGARAYGSAGMQRACSAATLQCTGGVCMGASAYGSAGMQRACSTVALQCGRRMCGCTCIRERWQAARMQYCSTAVREAYVWVHVHMGALACSAHAVL